MVEVEENVPANSNTLLFFVMQLPSSKQGLAVTSLPGFKMKLSTTDGWLNNGEGKFVMLAYQLASSI